MNRPGLIGPIGLTTALNSLYANQSLSITGPTTWTPGTSITLNVTDTYSDAGRGSYGFWYWLQVNSALAPFLTITGVSYFPPFINPNYGPDPTFPVVFTSNYGADAGFLSTQEPTGQMRSVDLGGTCDPPAPNGSYHVTDITFALAANAPVGTYTLNRTGLSPRGSAQFYPDFEEYWFPDASFAFTVVPEPSTLALLGLTGIAAGVMAYRRRK